MKRLFLIFVIIFNLLILNGCSSNNIKLDTYEDDFVKFDYNADVIKNTAFDSSDDILYFQMSSLIGDTTDNKDLSNNSCVNIWVSNTNSDTYKMYKDNPKVMFAAFFNMLLNTDEISSDDVDKTESTILECDKILSNGKHIKAKFLSIDENITSVATCNILSDTDKKKSTELVNVYNSITYKAPQITDKSYSDDYISMKYNPDVLETNKLTETDKSYIMVVRKQSKEFNTSNLFANSIIQIANLPVTSDFGNMYINNPDLCASLFNGALSTDEIEPSDITNGSCEKVLNDGRTIKVKFLNDVNKKNIIAIYSVTANEDNEVIKEFEKTYKSLSN